MLLNFKLKVMSIFMLSLFKIVFTLKLSIVARVFHKKSNFYIKAFLLLDKNMQLSIMNRTKIKMVLDSVFTFQNF